nr:hypothetical protein [Tissierella sp.]
MRSINKNFKVFIVIIFILGLFSANTWADKETKEKTKEEVSDSFETKISYGFNKYYKRDRTIPVPLEIEIKNNSESLEGEIQILFEKDRFDQKTLYEAYTQELDLEKGASKTIEMDVRIGDRRQAILKIVDVKENVIFEKKINFERGENPTEVTLGILSDSYDRLSFLGLIDLKSEGEGRDKKMISLADLKGAFPERKELLKSLDLILINDFDTQSLSKKQIEALEGYVKDGGILIAGSGSKYQKSLKGLGQLNYFYPDSTLKTEAYGGVLLAKGEAKEAGVLIKAGDVPAVYSKSIGKGKTIIMAFDPGEEDFLEWSGKSDFMRSIIKDNVTITTEEDMGYEEYNSMEDMVSYIPNEKGINFKNIAIIILLFLIVAGPVNYLVLKKIDKSELSWITIPLISLAFTLIIYLVGLGTKFDEPMTNNASVIRLNTQGQVEEAVIASGLFPFKEGNLRAVFNENTSLTINENDYNNEMKFNDKDIVTKYSSQKANTVDFMKMGRWESKTLSTSQEIPDIDIRVEDFRSDDKGLKGKLVNNSDLDLEGAILIYGGNYYKLEDINKKSTKEISISSQELRKKRSGYRIYEIVENIYPWRDDVLNGKDFLNDSSKQNMLQQALGSYLEAEGNFAFIIGYSRDAIADDIIMNDKKPNRMDRNLLMIPIEMNYKAGQKVELAEGVIRGKLESINGLSYDRNSGEMYGDGEAVFTMRVNNTIDVKNISAASTSSPDVIVYIYNYKSEEWEETDTSNIKIEEGDMGLYYNQEKGMRMKFQANPGKENSISQPLFTIKGVGK